MILESSVSTSREASRWLWWWRRMNNLVQLSIYKREKHVISYCILTTKQSSWVQRIWVTARVMRWAVQAAVAAAEKHQFERAEKNWMILKSKEPNASINTCKASEFAETNFISLHVYSVLDFIFIIIMMTALLVLQCGAPQSARDVQHCYEKR